MLDYRPETILQLEYEYARETLEQSVEDRRRIVEFYLLLAGGLGTIALTLVQLEVNRTPSVTQLDTIVGAGGRLPGIVYALIFWIVGAAGIITLLHLIRLRQAAHESMQNMNRIKEFYVERFPQLSEALTWRSGTLPPLNRLGSITFWLALLIMMLDSLAFGAGVLFLEARTQISLLNIAGGVSVLMMLWQTFIYFWMLRER